MLWSYVEHFTEKENWGDAYRMNGFLILTMDAIRHITNLRTIIHNGFEQDGHSTESQHYLANATDYHFETELLFLEQIFMVTATLKGLQIADRVGLGIYPDWNIPGFHLDVRGTRARWGRIGDTYVSFESALKYVQERGI